MKLHLLLVVAAAVAITVAPATAQDLGALGFMLTPPPGWTVFIHPDGTTVSMVQDAADVGRTEPAGARIRVYTGRPPNADVSAPWRVSGDPFETRIGDISAAVITVDAGTIRRRIVTASLASGHSYRFDLEAPLRLWDASAPLMERALMEVRFPAPTVAVQSSGSSTTLPVVSSATVPAPPPTPMSIPAPPASVQIPATNGQGPGTSVQVPPTSVLVAPTNGGQLPPANDRLPPANDRLPPTNGQLPPASAQAATCDISGRWQMNTANVGTSVWTFTRGLDGRYAGREAGLGNATGVATVIGTEFRLDWSTGGVAGYVTLTLDRTCAVGTGQQVFQQGRSGFETTSWQRLSGAPTQVGAPLPGGAPAAASTPQACDISGRWQMNTASIGTSIWTFTRRPDGLYNGQEAGLGSATGTATVIGTNFRLDWNTGAAGWAGYVTLTLDSNCAVGSGRHVFERGRGGSEATTWERR